MEQQLRHGVVALVFVTLAATGVAAPEGQPSFDSAGELNVTNYTYVEKDYAEIAFTFDDAEIVHREPFVVPAPVNWSANWTRYEVSGTDMVNPYQFFRRLQGGQGTTMEPTHVRGSATLDISGFDRGTYVAFFWGCEAGAYGPKNCRWLTPRVFERVEEESCQERGYTCIALGLQNQVPDDYKQVDAPCESSRHTCFAGWEERCEGPRAEFTRRPFTVTPGEPVSLTAESSRPCNASITTYQWYIKRDSAADATGVTATTRFDSPGTYDITLKVRDADDRTDTITRSVTVDPACTSHTDLSVTYKGAAWTFEDDIWHKEGTNRYLQQLPVATDDYMTINAHESADVRINVGADYGRRGRHYTINPTDYAYNEQYARQVADRGDPSSYIVPVPAPHTNAESATHTIVHETDCGTTRAPLDVRPACPSGYGFDESQCRKSMTVQAVPVGFWTDITPSTIDIDKVTTEDIPRGRYTIGSDEYRLLNDHVGGEPQQEAFRAFYFKMQEWAAEWSNMTPAVRERIDLDFSEPREVDPWVGHLSNYCIFSVAFQEDRRNIGAGGVGVDVPTIVRPPIEYQIDRWTAHDTSVGDYDIVVAESRKRLRAPPILRAVSDSGSKYVGGCATPDWAFRGWWNGRRVSVTSHKFYNLDTIHHEAGHLMGLCHSKNANGHVPNNHFNEVDSAVERGIDIVPADWVSRNALSGTGAICPTSEEPAASPQVMNYNNPSAFFPGDPDYTPPYGSSFDPRCSDCNDYQYLENLFSDRGWTR